VLILPAKTINQIKNQSILVKRQTMHARTITEG